MGMEEPLKELNLSPEHYRKLIELAYLGEWLINAHHDSEFQDDGASEVLQGLLAGRPMENIAQDAETEEYYLESEWTDRLYEQYVSDYDEHVFWDELTERLAQRDLANLRGVPIESIDCDEDLLELRPLEEVYRRELEDRGVERLEIRETF